MNSLNVFRDLNGRNVARVSLPWEIFYFMLIYSYSLKCTHVFTYTQMNSIGGGGGSFLYIWARDGINFGQYN